jgi:hypothetical protein
MARHVDESRRMRSLTASGPFWSWLRENPIDLIYIALTLYVGYNYFTPLPPHQGLALFCLLVFIGLFLRPRPAGGEIISLHCSPSLFSGMWSSSIMRSP